MNYPALLLCLGSCFAVQGQELLKKMQQKFTDAQCTAFSWQNTLRTSPEYSVGMYNKDLLNAGFFALFFAADTVLYNQLVDWSVDQTVTTFVHDFDALIEVLERGKLAERRFEERMAFAEYQGDTLLSKEEKKLILSNPLQRYLTKKLTFSLTNKTVLSYLGLRWLFDYVSIWAERQLIQPELPLLTQWLRVGAPEKVVRASEQAFVSRQGQLRPVVSAPYSALTILTVGALLVNPFVTLRAQLRSGKIAADLSTLKVIYLLLGAKLPQWLFSWGTRTVLDGVELQWAAYYLLRSLKNQWIEYALPQKEVLLRLLYSYRTVLENPAAQETHVQFIKKELKKFIKRGYQQRTNLPAVCRWWSAQRQSTYAMSDRVWLPTLALLAIKSAH